MSYGFYAAFSVKNVGVFSWNIKQKCISGKSQPSFYLLFAAQTPWYEALRCFGIQCELGLSSRLQKWLLPTGEMGLGRDSQSCAPAQALWDLVKAGCGKAVLAGSRTCHWSTCSDSRKHISVQLCCSTLSVFPNRFQASSSTVLSPGKEGSCWSPGRAHGAAVCHSTRESREGCNSFTSRGGRSRKSNARGRKPRGNRSGWEGGRSWRSSGDCGGSIGKPSSRKSCWSICQGSRKNCSFRSIQGVAVSDSWGRHSCSPRCLMGCWGWQCSLPWAELTDPNGMGGCSSRAELTLTFQPCLRSIRPYFYLASSNGKRFLFGKNWKQHGKKKKSQKLLQRVCVLFPSGFPLSFRWAFFHDSGHFITPGIVKVTKHSPLQPPWPHAHPVLKHSYLGIKKGPRVVFAQPRIFIWHLGNYALCCSWVCWGW